MNQSTPGPWHAQNHYVVTDRHERLEVIARCGGHADSPLRWACHEADLENAANVRLIAAAQRLHEALLCVVDTLKWAKSHGYEKMAVIDLLDNQDIKDVITEVEE